MVLEALTDKAHGVVGSILNAFGHRVVHGGEKFAETGADYTGSYASIEDCIEMAPLHNPPNILGINACSEIKHQKKPLVKIHLHFHCNKLEVQIRLIVAFLCSQFFYRVFLLILFFTSSLYSAISMFLD